MLSFVNNLVKIKRSSTNHQEKDNKIASSFIIVLQLICELAFPHCYWPLTNHFGENEHCVLCCVFFVSYQKICMPTKWFEAYTTFLTQTQLVRITFNRVHKIITFWDFMDFMECSGRMLAVLNNSDLPYLHYTTIVCKTLCNSAHGRKKFINIIQYEMHVFSSCLL